MWRSKKLNNRTHTTQHKAHNFDAMRSARWQTKFVTSKILLIFPFFTFKTKFMAYTRCTLKGFEQFCFIYGIERVVVCVCVQQQNSGRLPTCNAYEHAARPNLILCRCCWLAQHACVPAWGVDDRGQPCVKYCVGVGGNTVISIDILGGSIFKFWMR